MSEKHLDVKPGHVPVSHTSRPIITGTESPTRDPMVTTPDPAKSAEAPFLHKELKLQPPNLKAESQTNTSAKPDSVEPAAAELPQSIAVSDTDKVSPEDIVPKLVAEKTYKLPISPTPAKRILLILILVSIAIVVLALLAMFVLSSR